MLNFSARGNLDEKSNEAAIATAMTFDCLFAVRQIQIINSLWMRTKLTDMALREVYVTFLPPAKYVTTGRKLTVRMRNEEAKLLIRIWGQLCSMINTPASFICQKNALTCKAERLIHVVQKCMKMTYDILRDLWTQLFKDILSLIYTPSWKITLG